MCSLSTQLLAGRPIDDLWVSSALDFLACYVHVGEDAIASNFFTGENAYGNLKDFSSAAPLMQRIAVDLFDLPAQPGMAPFNDTHFEA